MGHVSEVSNARSLATNIDMDMRVILRLCLSPGPSEIGRSSTENEPVDGSRSIDPISIDRDQRRHR